MCRGGGARLDGRVALVTGGGSGMGLQAARALAARGARVLIASRNADKLRRARDQLRADTGNPRVDFLTFDLASLGSVRALARHVAREPRLDVLLNNAGEIGLPDARTQDGHSLMLQVNFLGPFLLTFLLLPLLRRSAPSRVLHTGAVTMYLGDLDFEHWDELGRYDLLRASGNAKLAVFLNSAEWARRLNGTRVTSNTVDPFITKDTDIAKRSFRQIADYLNKRLGTDGLESVFDIFYNLIGAEPQTLGKELAYYASAPEMANVTGEHFSFCRKLPPHWILRDTKLRKRLWKEAKKLVNITPEEDWEQWENFL